MSWLKTIINEALGLFIDDGRFAFAIVIWLGVAASIFPFLEISDALRGALLFVGLGVILGGSAAMAARRGP